MQLSIALGSLVERIEDGVAEGESISGLHGSVSADWDVLLREVELTKALVDAEVGSMAFFHQE